jgi:hypothetical protein
LKDFLLFFLDFIATLSLTNDFFFSALVLFKSSFTKKNSAIPNNTIPILTNIAFIQFPLVSAVDPSTSPTIAVYKNPAPNVITANPPYTIPPAIPSPIKKNNKIKYISYLKNKIPTGNDISQANSK